jgi:hypothetical protein
VWYGEKGTAEEDESAEGKRRRKIEKEINIDIARTCKYTGPFCIPAGLW